MREHLKFLARRGAPLVSVIRLQGVIANGGSGRLNDAGLAPLINRAFRKGKPAAVALILNSPGGSPVQSSLIAARIRRLSEEKEVPVFAFVEDVAASGGYWLACAADEIYADTSSVVGSIGVISAGFGLNNFIQRYGIERRVYTAGESKSMLDPFQAEKPEDVARLKELQGEIHEAFKAHVSERRGARLSQDPQLFTGAFWTGQKAHELGLVDGIGHLVPVMKQKFGEKTRFAVYRQKKSLFSRFGAQLSNGVVEGLDDQLLQSRYDLS
ncbi:S49 family peptidase [Palleronia caenipelagi]|uniref:S49 family peptidase n=1 Tax=Palleronia caenipelagi TaxID=2489174 RepID=A0A547Q6U2_9RHOB|nr:S49 family peptidase [Palleronia caenipelagi]TRD22106.1 S49 family peptidase [Palleronia caenipelagi]